MTSISVTIPYRDLSVIMPMGAKEYTQTVYEDFVIDQDGDFAIDQDGDFATVLREEIENVYVVRAPKRDLSLIVPRSDNG